MSAPVASGYPRSIAVLVSLMVLIGSALVAPAVAFAVDPPPPLAPIDPQVVTQAADQDWSDYHPIPTGPNYADNSITPTNTRWDVALVLADFPGTPFAVTQDEGSTVFGNPGPLAHNLPRASVGAFYRDWLNIPSAINEFQGMNRYWMEDTYGQYGVNLQSYGPYELIGTQDDYFINDISGSSNATCNTQARTANNGTPQLAVTDVALALPSTSASFSVGKILRGMVTASTGTFNRVVTEIPDAGHIRTGAASTMAAASAAGATNIKYSATAGLQGLASGHTLWIGMGERLEVRTIVNAGTSGNAGTGLTLDAPLTYLHSSGTYLRDMTTSAINSVPANAFIYSCDRNFRTDIAIAWADFVTQAERISYDNSFLVSAGQDESGTWQEFGEMQFTGGSFAPDTVPEAFGPPNNEIPQNWADTRYIEWTSWASAATVWPSASGTSSTEGEGSGMAVYAHELTHNLGIGDNYNNPYIAPFQRAATGYWSMMSRGSFGGPGGTHSRWHIPSTMGTALGSQHVLRDKIALGFVPAADFTDLNRNGLGTSGLAVLDIQAREAAPVDGNQLGVRINLDGGDQTVACTVMATPRVLAANVSAGSNNIKVDNVGGFTVNSDVVVGDRGHDELVRVQSVGTAGSGGSGITFTTNLTNSHTGDEIVSNRLTCSGTAGFNNYILEINQQIGSDSFQPATGVLIEKNKTGSSSCGTFTCFAWVVDAHPTDINMLDFERPDDTNQWVTTGDPRQLTDATFHAGTNSGSLYEWEDTRNGLHFYILDRSEVNGVVHYKVGVQNISSAGAAKGPHTRGVELSTPAAMVFEDNYGYCNFDLTNTGSFNAFANPHPEGASAVNSMVANDIYRLSASATGAGWHAQLANALEDLTFGASANVPVYVTHDEGADADATISLTATSVSDPSETITSNCVIDNSAPVTTADLQPPAVNDFYHDPTVTLTADDGIGSGVALTEYDIDGSGWLAYSSPFQVTGDGDHTLLFRSTDNIGHVEDTNTLNFTIDATGPVITIDAPVEAVTQVVGAPGNYPLGSEQEASYSCLDAISGHTSCDGPVESGELFDTNTVGYHTFTVTSDDLAGNSSEKTVQYNVVWDGMTGFLQPIGSGTNAAQANRAVPIKFSLGGDYGMNVFASGYPISTPVDCTTLAPTGPALATQAAEPLSYQDGQYKYVWKTKKPWAGTCRMLEIKLVDNTVHTALFQFHN